MAFYEPDTKSEWVNTEYLAGMDPAKEIQKHIVMGRTPERMERERDWKAAWYAYRNRPWWFRNWSTGRMQRIQEQDREKVVVFNLIRPRIDTLVGNESYFPKFIGRNNAQIGSEEQMRIRAVGDLANHCVKVSRFAACKADADLNKHLFGLCWLKQDWDPESGPVAPVYGAVICDVCNGTSKFPMPDNTLADCPRCAAQGFLPSGQDPPPIGHTLEVTGDAPEGELLSRCIPPWEILSDSASPNPIRPQWLLHEYIMNREEAWELHCAGSGVELDDIQEKNQPAMSDSAYQFAFMQQQQYPANDTNLVLVREFFKRFGSRHAKYPHGMQITLVGEHVVYAGPMKLAHGRIPFVPYRGYTMPGAYYPLSTADALQAVQLAHMGMATDWWQHVHMANLMRVLVTKDMGFELTDVQGVAEYVPGRDGKKPEILKDAGVPADTYQFLDRCASAADEQSYSNDVLRGVVGSGEDTKAYASWRETRAVNPIRRMLNDNAESIQEYARLLVDGAKLLYPDGRLLRDVYGPLGAAKVRVMRTELFGDSADVELLPEKDIGRSIASRRQEIIEAANSPAWGQPEFMDMMELGNQKEVFGASESDQTVATTENDLVRAMIRGEEAVSELAPPIELENHDAHEKEHMPLWHELCANRAFGKSHPVTQVIYQHLLLHRQMKNFEMGKNAAIQQQGAAANGLAAASGGAGTPPAIPPPAGSPVAPEADGMVPSGSSGLASPGNQPPPQ